MRKLICSRQSGKTTKLLYVSHVMGYTILVAHEPRKTHLENEAKRLHLCIPEPITVSDLLHKDKVQGNWQDPMSRHILIDDGDDVLDAFIHQSIGGVVEVISLATDNLITMPSETNE